MIASFRQLYQRYNQLRGRQIFIIPTRFGFMYAGFVLLILLGAVNYSNSLGHVLAFLLGSLGLIAMFHSYRNITKIELVRGFSDSVFVGQAITFTIFFENQSNHINYHIDISSKQKQTRSWVPFSRLTGYQHSQSVTQLPAQQVTQFGYSLPSQKRGKQTLGRLRLGSQFPLGLYTTWTYFKTDYVALVYPKPEGDLPLPLTSAHGENTQPQPQKGMDDFVGFNNYRLGDALHSVAWKAMARDDVLRTKQFSSLQGGQVMLNWHDVSQLDTVEARLSQLCRWILQADSSGLSYGLTLPNHSIDYGQGEAHRHRCLSSLALYE